MCIFTIATRAGLLYVYSTLINLYIMESSPKTLQAQIDALTVKIERTAKSFNSKSFTASIVINGSIQDTDETFVALVTCTETDPEIVTFFNDYCTRLIAERMRLMMELEKLQNLTPNFQG